jgi:hypothetical protein
MLGKSYMNPTMPAGVFGSSLCGTVPMSSLSNIALPAGAYWISDDGANVTTDTTGHALYADASGNIYNDQGKIDSTVVDTKTSTGLTFKDIWNGLPAIVKAADLPSTIAAIKGQHPGISDAEATRIATLGKSGGFNIQANLPWIVLGGAALLAIVFMMGTRRRS